MIYCEKVSNQRLFISQRPGQSYFQASAVSLLKQLKYTSKFHRSHLQEHPFTPQVIVLALNTQLHAILNSILILFFTMIKKVCLPEFSDDEEEQSVVRPQNTQCFEANGCKQEDRDTRPVRTVTNTENEYQLIEPGLMLEGWCLTPQCHAYNKKALHIFRFVENLNFASARYKAKCRLCNKVLKQVKNIGFYKTTMDIFGKLEGQEDFFNQTYTADDDRYHTFKDGKDKNVMWEFLEITTRKLQK